jgi:hypothetical protein
VVSTTAPLSTWRLTGPWYRWPRPGLPEDGRNSIPAIQKFAGADFSAQFLATPQHSLKYDEFVDVVQSHDLVKGGKLPGKIATMLALDAKGDPVNRKTFVGDIFRTRLAPTPLRKLYQPTHDRHYIVSCELHCDAPGFPRVDRKKVCQAGFVVRRRRSKVPDGMPASDIEAEAAKVRKAEADLFELLTLQATADDPTLPQPQRDHASARMQRVAVAAGHSDWSAFITAQRSKVATARTGFDTWQSQHGISVTIEGWFPQAAGSSPHAQRGEWRTVPDELADITTGEQTYPLFALVPDPRLTTHDAAGRTMYYGVVPTQDLQHDLAGKPHFDDLSTYELRCFVREHHPCPGRTAKLPDCHGPVTWSRATQAFRLAPAFDVLGCANRPVTIKMPDLRDLAAQAALRPRGKLSPVHFVQPQHMSPDGIMGGAAICSFSIPLITIIALFVLNLFLPVVVFLFQLWFLLVLRFCIPPQIELDAGIDAALAVTPPGIDFEADLDVQVEGLAADANALHGLLDTAMKTHIKADAGLGGKPMPLGLSSDPDLSDLDNNGLAASEQSFADNAALKVNADGSITPPETGTPLVYEDPVTPVWPRKGLT